LPEKYKCAACQKIKISKNLKCATKKIKKKDNSTDFPQDNKMALAPLDLLLSAAENISMKSPVKKFSEPTSEGKIKKAVIQGNFVYLSSQFETDSPQENMIKLPRPQRNINSLFLDKLNGLNSK
jgi:hypothetical protein